LYSIPRQTINTCRYQRKWVLILTAIALRTPRKQPIALLLGPLAPNTRMQRQRLSLRRGQHLQGLGILHFHVASHFEALQRSAKSFKLGFAPSSKPGSVRRRATYSRAVNHSLRKVGTLLIAVANPGLADSSNARRRCLTLMCRSRLKRRRDVVAKEGKLNLPPRHPRCCRLPAARLTPPLPHCPTTCAHFGPLGSEDAEVAVLRRVGECFINAFLSVFFGVEI
jgi:hypothetical protein